MLPTAKASWVFCDDRDKATDLKLNGQLPRIWHYYTAWASMVLILIGFLTGVAVTLIRDGRIIIQHYVEKIEYGLDK